MVTQEMLAQLRAEQNRVQNAPSYTIGGTIQRDVHAQVERQRNQTISRCEQSLQEALQNMRQERAFATREGLAQVHFNYRAKETIS